MPKSVYTPGAVEICRKYYIEFGGNPDLIQKAMRRDYPSWGKSNLFDKGKGRGDKNARLGWINRYGFEKSMSLHQQTQISSIESDDERRYRAVVTLADHFQEKALQGEEKAVDKFIKLTDQQINLRTKLDLTSSNFESFVEAFEQMVLWAKDIDMDLAKLFYRRKDEFIKRASTHYGKQDIVR